MKQRVLVVDDDRLVADTLRMVFAKSGFESEACYSATEALGRAKAFVPQLILCDVTMPDKNGFELAAEVLRDLPRCQMIMLTAYLTSAGGLEFEELRGKYPLRLLNKPCNPEQLLREADELLRQARDNEAA